MKYQVMVVFGVLLVHLSREKGDGHGKPYLGQLISRPP
jgi:hypothetical protein